MTINRISTVALVVLLSGVGLCIPIFGQDAAASSSIERIADKSFEQTVAVHFENVGRGNSKQTGTTGPSPAPQSSPAKVSLTPRQKLRYGLHEAFLTPGAYLGPAVNAYFTERFDVKALGKTGEDKFADGLSRFGRAFTTRATAELLGSGVYPALFKQNPIYQPSGKHGFMRRALYGASRALITSADNGKHQPNFSRLLGNLTSSSLANLYERDSVERRDARGRVLKFNRRVGVSPTLQSFGISTALDALTYVVFDEFAVLRKLRKILKRP